MGEKSRLEGLSDEQLMLAFARADSAAFDIIYSRYSARVYAYMTARVKDKSVAEDLLQETFLKLYRFKERYDPQLPFSGWIFTICRNCFLDFARKNKRQEIPGQDLSEISTSEGDQPGRAGITDLTDSLSGTETDILYLRYTEDLQYADIADRLGLSTANARKIASRAVAKLRELLR